jgi:uncharacterized membrane protein
MTEFLDVDLSFLGWPHAAACLLAMGAFFPIMFTRKGGATHLTMGRIYAIAYLIACVTSLGIYKLHKFWFPHWLAVTGIVMVTAGYLAIRYKPRGWRYIHLTAMLLSASDLFGGAVNEAFLHIKPLRAMAGPNLFASPIIGVLQGIVGQLFIGLIVAYAISTALRSRRRAKQVLVEESQS